MSFWNPQNKGGGPAPLAQNADRQTNYVNWYNSLAPSTRAYAQAPDQVDWDANDAAVNQWNAQSGDNQPLNRFASPGPNPGLNPGPNPGPGYVPPATPPPPDFGPLPGNTPPPAPFAPQGAPPPFASQGVPPPQGGGGSGAPAGGNALAGMSQSADLQQQQNAGPQANPPPGPPRLADSAAQYYTPPVIQRPIFAPGGTPQASGSPVVNAMMRRYKRGFW